MMNKAKGPVWHKKQKEQGIIPEGLRGIDKEATWCKSNADGWVYGHGTFTITFDIDHCWMRGDSNNRWLFAAMGLTIQMHQFEAYKKGKSTWNIKEQVLG
jgi:hypothetical protein